MDALRTGVSSLGAIDRRPSATRPISTKRSRCRRVSPAFWRRFFRLRQGLEPVQPKAEHNTAQSYLYQLFGNEPEERHWKPLEIYLVLLADHGMNASTFTARVIASTQSDLCSAITGARRRAQGPPAWRRAVQGARHAQRDRHGRQRRHLADNALDRGDRLMGFGHRVYKAEDPRAEILREMARTASDPDFFALSLTTETERSKMLTSANRAAGSTPTSSSTPPRCWPRSACRATCSRRPSPFRARSAGAPTCSSRFPTTG